MALHGADDELRYVYDHFSHTYYASRLRICPLILNAFLTPSRRTSSCTGFFLAVRCSSTCSRGHSSASRRGAAVPAFLMNAIYVTRTRGLSDGVVITYLSGGLYSSPRASAGRPVRGCAGRILLHRGRTTTCSRRCSCSGDRGVSLRARTTDRRSALAPVVVRRLVLDWAGVLLVGCGLFARAPAAGSLFMRRSTGRRASATPRIDYRWVRGARLLVPSSSRRSSRWPGGDAED